MKAVVVGLVLGSLLSPATVAGQNPDDLVRQGLEAYRALDYDRAATLLRGALSTVGPEALPDSVRASNYLYLGATYLFLGHPDSASAAFRQALAMDPRIRPDTLIFPPQITQPFQVARRRTAYLRIGVPPDTTLPAAGRYPIRIYASAPHETVVELVDDAGHRAHRLYLGFLADSIDLRWDGRDSTGRTPLTGSLTLQVTMRPATGAASVTRLPLTVSAVTRDTVPLPLQPVTNIHPTPPRPAQFESKRRPELLAAGLLSGAAVVILPRLVASDKEGWPTRLVLGGTLGLAGVIGFVTQRSHGRPIPSAASAPVSSAWQRSVDSVRAENERRRRDFRIRITAGTSTATVAGGM